MVPDGGCDCACCVLHDDEQTGRLDDTIVSIPPWHDDFVVQYCSSSSQ
jgi:hypothetical protein